VPSVRGAELGASHLVHPVLRTARRGCGSHLRRPAGPGAGGGSHRSARRVGGPRRAASRHGTASCRRPSSRGRCCGPRRPGPGRGGRVAVPPLRDMVAAAVVDLHDLWRSSPGVRRGHAAGRFPGTRAPAAARRLGRAPWWGPPARGASRDRVGSLGVVGALARCRPPSGPRRTGRDRCPAGAGAPRRCRRAVGYHARRRPAARPGRWARGALLATAAVARRRGGDRSGAGRPRGDAHRPLRPACRDLAPA
jgi:hypothetical protein